MALKTKQMKKQPQTERATRKSKFQADLAPAEDRMVRGLKQELQLTSNTDFLSDALALFRWAVWERKRGHRIFSETETGERKELVFPRLERVAPELVLPRVEIPWAPRELESLADVIVARPSEVFASGRVHERERTPERGVVAAATHVQVLENEKRVLACVTPAERRRDPRPGRCESGETLGLGGEIVRLRPLVDLDEVLATAAVDREAAVDAAAPRRLGSLDAERARDLGNRCLESGE